jgi:molybdate transport system substrate-binding protein
MSQKLKKYLFIILVSLAGLNSLAAEDIMIASGAGYKKPVSAVMKAFETKSGNHVDAVYGNIHMVANQAKQTGEICCIIGDKKFLKRLESTVTFADYSTIGKGRVALIYRKGVELSSVDDIATNKVQSLFMPHETKAIYGIAGKEIIAHYGYGVKDKLTQVATVPQVLSYVLTGEADAGFINMTEALANKDKLGGYIVVPEDSYTPIIIVAGFVEDFENKTTTKDLKEFLAAPKATEIFESFGLK